MLNRRFLLLAHFLFLAFALYGCGEPNRDSSLKSSSPSKFERQHLGTVHFSRWPEDYILMSTVLKEVEGGCEFAKPVRSDKSHYVGPVQSMWVIHSREKSSDVKEVKGLFHQDDLFSLDSVPTADEGPLSLRPLSSFGKKRLKVEDVSVPESNELVLQLSVNTPKVKAGEKTLDSNGAVEAFIKAKPRLVDGRCSTENTYCVKGEACDETASFSKLTVHLTKALIPKIESVEIN